MSSERTLYDAFGVRVTTSRMVFPVRITTTGGSKIAFAARDRALVEEVAAAVRQAIAQPTDAPAPGAPRRSARGRRRR